MMIKILIVNQILLPIFIGAINFISRSRTISYYLSLITSLISTALSIALYYPFFFQRNIGDTRYYFGGWMPPIGIEFKLNYINALFLLIVSIVASLTFLCGRKILYQEIDKNKIPNFCSVFLICLSGLYGIILTNDFFNLYVFIEIASITTYALISISRDKKSLNAAFYYLIIGTIGATFILIAIGYIYSISGTLNIDNFVENMAYKKNPKTFKFASCLMLAGLFIKSGLFPFHSWLIKAYRSTNSFILPFLGSVSTKVYILAVLKLVYVNFEVKNQIFNDNLMQGFIIVSGVAAMIFGAISALHQKDLRSILAFSSVSQIGYIFVAIGIGTQVSYHAAIFLIGAHVLAKMALFVLSANIYQYKGSYHKDSLFMLYKDMPYTVIIFIINAASLVGIPLTFGFFVKIELLHSLIFQRMWLVIVAVAIASFLTLKYLWSVIEIFLFHKTNALLEQSQDATFNDANIGIMNTSTGIAPILVATFLTFINLAAAAITVLL